MLQHFFRRAESGGFRTRSAERDAHSDRATLAAVGSAIDQALTTLETERDGLGQRFNEARDRASAAAGTEADEYLTREVNVGADLRRLEQEMIRATARLQTLDEEIANLRFVRAVFYSRFTSLAAK